MNRNKEYRDWIEFLKISGCMLLFLHVHVTFFMLPILPWLVCTFLSSTILPYGLLSISSCVTRSYHVLLLPTLCIQLLLFLAAPFPLHISLSSLVSAAPFMSVLTLQSAAHLPCFCTVWHVLVMQLHLSTSVAPLPPILQVGSAILATIRPVQFVQLLFPALGVLLVCFGPSFHACCWSLLVSHHSVSPVPSPSWHAAAHASAIFFMLPIQFCLHHEQLAVHVLPILVLTTFLQLHLFPAARLVCCCVPHVFFPS